MVVERPCIQNDTGYEEHPMTVTRSHKAELVWRIRDKIELDLQTDIAEADPARVTTIVVGKFSDEPRGIVLSVHSTHPLGPEGGRIDGIAEGFPRSFHDRPWELPAESLGGSQWDRIYGTVQVRCLQKYAPEDALEIVDMVKTRIAVVLNSGSAIVPFIDPYGYCVFSLRCSSRFGYASGGGNTATDAHWCDFVAMVSSERVR